YLFMRKGPCLAIRRKMVQRRPQEYRFGPCAEAAGNSRSPFEASRRADTGRRWSKCTLALEQGRKSMECAISGLREGSTSFGEFASVSAEYYCVTRWKSAMV